MSFTMSLLLAYIVMGVGSFIAFKRKHKAIGIALLLTSLDKGTQPFVVCDG